MLHTKLSSLASIIEKYVVVSLGRGGSRSEMRFSVAVEKVWVAFWIGNVVGL